MSLCVCSFNLPCVRWLLTGTKDTGSVNWNTKTLLSGTNALGTLLADIDEFNIEFAEAPDSLGVLRQISGTKLQLLPLFSQFVIFDLPFSRQGMCYTREALINNLRSNLSA